MHPQFLLRALGPFTSCGRQLGRALLVVVLALALLSAVPAPANALDELVIDRLDVVGVDGVYDARRHQLYVSVPSTAPAYGNRVVAIDPTSGEVVRSVFVGSEPSALALSDDGSTLYVGLAGANSLVRVETTDLTVVGSTVLFAGTGHLVRLAYVEDLEVQPGNADVVVVSLKGSGISPRHLGVVAVDEGVVRPVATPGHTGANRLALGPDATTFYGYNNESTSFGVYTLSLQDDGVRVEQVTSSLLSGFGASVEFQDGNLYSTTGRVVHPPTGAVRGTYALGGSVEPVASTNETYVFNRQGLHVFHRTEFTPLGSYPFTASDASTGALVATADGLAAVTGDGAVYLFNWVEPEPPFSDIAGHTHEVAIAAIVDVGVASGYRDGTFRPDRSVTRGQMATFLSRALELEPVTSGAFTDIAGHTHEAAIRSLAAAGIAGGFADGRFRPDDSVTRAQMATFLERAFEMPPATAPAPFTDVSGTHADAIAAVYQAGVTGGTGGDRFSPKAPVRRGQMATFLARSLDLVDRLR